MFSFGSPSFNLFGFELHLHFGRRKGEDGQLVEPKRIHESEILAASSEIVDRSATSTFSPGDGIVGLASNRCGGDDRSLYAIFCERGLCKIGPIEQEVYIEFGRDSRWTISVPMLYQGRLFLFASRQLEMDQLSIIAKSDAIIDVESSYRGKEERLQKMMRGFEKRLRLARVGPIEKEKTVIYIMTDGEIAISLPNMSEGRLLSLATQEILYEQGLISKNSTSNA